MQGSWAQVAEAIRSGEPSFPATYWEHLAAHPEEEHLFAEAMRELTGLVKTWVATSYPWPPEGTVCDVAGGSGPLLAAVLAQRPALRGQIVEAKGVLPEADAFLRAAAVRERVELIEGDIFGRIDAAADLYLLKEVLHDYDDERCLQVLKSVRAPMRPGAKVVLVETVIGPDEPSALVSRIDTHMLTQCDGGRQRSLAERQALLRTAELTPGAVHRTAGPALVEGVA